MLFKKSRQLFGCIPSDKFLVIHRSALSKAVEQQDKSFLNDVLKTLDNTETTNQDSEPKVNPNQGYSGILDQLNAEGNTMMHMSTSKRDIESTRLLLNCGANFNLLNAEANTPLHIAVGMRDIEMTRLLLAHKADPSLETPEGNRLMHKIVDLNDLETTELLLLHGANLNLRNGDGDTLVHITAKRNDINTTRLLFDNRADPWLKDADGKSPVDILQKTKEGAHLLVHMASEGRLEKEDVGTMMCSKNGENSLILATLDKEPQRIAASFNKNKTCLSLAYMGDEFLKWVYTEAEEGRWPSETVFKALVKENVGGVDVITSRIKPGNIPCPIYCKFSPFKNDINDHLRTEFELASSGPGGAHCGATLGRYELVPGEQINGSPVYKQAHSKEVPTRWRYKYKLHRWDKPLHLHPYSSSPGLETSGELTTKMETIGSKQP